VALSRISGARPNRRSASASSSHAMWLRSSRSNWRTLALRSSLHDRETTALANNRMQPTAPLAAARAQNGRGRLVLAIRRAPAPQLIRVLRQESLGKGDEVT